MGFLSFCSFVFNSETNSFEGWISSGSGKQRSNRIFLKWSLRNFQKPLCDRICSACGPQALQNNHNKVISSKVYPPSFIAAMIVLKSALSNSDFWVIFPSNQWFLTFWRVWTLLMKLQNHVKIAINKSFTTFAKSKLLNIQSMHQIKDFSDCLNSECSKIENIILIAVEFCPSFTDINNLDGKQMLKRYKKLWTSFSNWQELAKLEKENKIDWPSLNLFIKKIRKLETIFLNEEFSISTFYQISSCSLLFILFQ